jgi:hypothetical protein
VPVEEKMLNDLLQRARRSGLILQSADEQWFVLASIEKWGGFDVGEDDDFHRNETR